ncbi:uncharacterized protein LOC127277552 [Leptopilina boulardi]|uniref:uncharacterized protein LOC127277552 n=1 Tax=Leptopilina boulardi TaxID=63433 RepID=UPI0021F668EF|nr:uncharacterized protein LOC127277552 [Leptopilina boulardi]
MAKIILLLCTTFFISTSCFKIENVNKNDLKSDLRTKLNKILTTTYKSDMKVKININNEKKLHNEERMSRLRKEEEILSNDLEKFQNGKIFKKINIYCEKTKIIYKKQKIDAYEKYGHCLQFKYDIIETIADMMYDSYPFLEKIINTNQQLTECLSLDEKKYSKASNSCLTKLKADIDKYEEEYLKVIENYENHVKSNIQKYVQSGYPECDNLYKKRYQQLQHKIEICS